MALALVLGASSLAQAQTPDPESKWSAEFGVGWDNSISGNINSSAIGSINNTAVVITKNTYDDVYNKGLHMRFGGGYMLNEDLEARVTFTFQSARCPSPQPLAPNPLAPTSDLVALAGPRVHADASTLSSAPRPHMNHRMRALLVEDDASIADFVVRGLKEAGFAVDHRGGRRGRVDGCASNSRTTSRLWT